MPKRNGKGQYVKRRKGGRRRKKMSGGSWAGDALNFTKKNKLISRGASAAAPYLGSWAPVARGVGWLAGQLGWGDREQSGRLSGAGPGLGVVNPRAGVTV